MLFVDLFAGMGGFHRALAALGHECVFASELDEELRELYVENFPAMRGRVHGDIRKAKDLVPPHDILCAGFPCQPFSKSGEQLGTRDETRGTLFHEILDVLKKRRPRFFILENVGNFGRHDKGRTWAVVQRRLRALGYDVKGTEHVTPPSRNDWRDAGAQVLEFSNWQRPSARVRSPGGYGLLSPHHFGHPHHRERFFIVGALDGLPEVPFPVRPGSLKTSLEQIVQDPKELGALDREETRLSQQQVRCIEHWNKLIATLPSDVEPPSFPLWGDELGLRYSFEVTTPWNSRPDRLRQAIAPHLPAYTRKEELLQLLPNYAREPVAEFRQWKKSYIRRNRDWWDSVKDHLPSNWYSTLQDFPWSLRKLEWNAKGGERDLWRYVLQFRPSGLRVKRYTSSPALVAMTDTQIPVLGPERRFLTRVEGLRLQGFPDEHRLPRTRFSAFKALGNGVHVSVVMLVAAQLLASERASTASHCAARKAQ